MKYIVVVVLFHSASLLRVNNSLCAYLSTEEKHETTVNIHWRNQYARGAAPSSHSRSMLISQKSCCPCPNFFYRRLTYIHRIVQARVHLQHCYTNSNLCLIPTSLQIIGSKWKVIKRPVQKTRERHYSLFKNNEIGSKRS